jgi:hypothetical protein
MLWVVLVAGLVCCVLVGLLWVGLAQTIGLGWSLGVFLAFPRAFGWPSSSRGEGPCLVVL